MSWEALITCSVARLRAALAMRHMSPWGDDGCGGEMRRQHYRHARNAIRDIRYYRARASETS